MTHEEGTFSGAGGLDLYRQAWRPEGAVRAALAVVHGFGEHSGRYQSVVDALVPRGFAVHSFDHRGHGRSPGQRGHVHGWAEFRQDVGAFLDLVRAVEGDRPIFVMGHSLGGLMVLEFALHHPDGLCGIIASGPSLAPPGISPFLLALGRFLSRLWPRFSMDTRLDSSRISRDPAVVEAYRNDPLVHRLGSARLGAEMQRAVAWVHAHADRWRLPLLVVHGGADRLVPSEGSRAFHAKVTFGDKELRILPGGYHEPHNDVDREEFLEYLAAWLESRLATQVP
jgi:alpha-beta hydrolase superfamily lysophospholipase